MLVVPAVCEGCGLARLCTIEDAARAQVACTDCGGGCRIVPGSSFAAKDGELFDALSRAVQSASLTATEASDFAAQIHQAIVTASHVRVLAVLSQRVSGLTATGDAIGRNPVAQRRALLMLKAIMDGAIVASAREVGSVSRQPGHVS